ncbi:MAG TPA: penicillin-binding transpeptidase domain-containing protein, partial [Candidatus Woesebacteria bacterium]|nr:penicillin-binding transpeptidase domain-containing protein [Candidatus Woesebacteria bacterium]
MNKIRFLFLLICGGLAAVIIKLFFIQILYPSYFAADYINTSKIMPNRGKILDRNYQPMAINQTKYLLYVEPQKMKSKDDLIEAIDDVLEIGEATLEARIDPSKVWVSIKGNIEKEKKEQLEALQVPGIGFEEETHRFYPEASLSAHLLGFLGKDKDGEPVGYFGLEGYYNRDLTGLPGVLKSERDLFNRPIFIGTQEKVDADDGRDFVMTIDKSVQHIIKQHLKKGVEQFKAKSGCVIAANPNTMEIIGLSCLPDYDPGIYYEFSERDFINSTISSGYEPGSTFKPLVMAAAIEEGLVKPNDRFNEDGAVTITGYRIQNWNDTYEGNITISRILEKSSNVGMVYLGEKLGNKKLYEYIKKFGFGEYTNIDLQGESTGQVKTLDTWYPIDAATMSFGQGILVTPMQLMRAFAAVINGGNLMRPYVVKEVVENGFTKEREPQIQRRVISEKTSAIMRKMLVDTVNNAEVSWKVPEGFTFGGKTGTAQIAF